MTCSNERENSPNWLHLSHISPNKQAFVSSSSSILLPSSQRQFESLPSAPYWRFRALTDKSHPVWRKRSYRFLAAVNLKWCPQFVFATFRPLQIDFFFASYMMTGSVVSASHWINLCVRLCIWTCSFTVRKFESDLWHLIYDRWCCNGTVMLSACFCCTFLQSCWWLT